MSLVLTYNKCGMSVEVAPERGYTTLTYKALSRLAAINPLKLEACEFGENPCFMLRYVKVGDKVFSSFYFYISDDPTFKSFLGRDVTEMVDCESYVKDWVSRITGGKEHER